MTSTIKSVQLQELYALNMLEIDAVSGGLLLDKPRQIYTNDGGIIRTVWVDKHGWPVPRSEIPLGRLR